MSRVVDSEAIGMALRRILAEQLGQDVASFKGDQRLAEDLAIDSLDHVELFMALEEFFEITITDEESDACKTVDEIAALIERKLS